MTIRVLHRMKDGRYQVLFDGNRYHFLSLQEIDVWNASGAQIVWSKGVRPHE